MWSRAFSNHPTLCVAILQDCNRTEQGSPRKRKFWLTIRAESVQESFQETMISATKGQFLVFFLHKLQMLPPNLLNSIYADSPKEERMYYMYRRPPIIYHIPHPQKAADSKVMFVFEGVVYDLPEPKRAANYTTRPRVQLRCSTWFSWGWCTNCGVRMY